MDWLIDPPAFFIMTFWICATALVIGLTAAILWQFAAWCFGL